MREIKFRAWFGEHELLEDIVYPWMITGDGSIYHVGRDIEYSDYQLIQHTGLKDKNGKEIYEGDVVEMEAIVSYPGEYGADIDRLYTGEVVIISSKGVCLKRPKCIERNDDNREWRCQHYKNVVSYRSEIIGNIYENPELLERKE